MLIDPFAEHNERVARAHSALAYLAEGHRILALRGKRPHPNWHKEWSWDNSFWGTPQTEQDWEYIGNVFSDPSVTGIAILIPPHHLVADIDTEEAAALFKDLAGVPANTRIARTTKGMHVWYFHPPAHGSRWLGDRTLLFKGFGGYVAVEPSIHFTDDTLKERDGTYEWIDREASLDWLPEGIAEMLKVQDDIAAMVPKRGDNDDMTRFHVDGLKWWPEWNLDGLAHAIENAKDGNQNNMIHWAACVARDGGVPLPVCMEILGAAAERGNHPKSRWTSTIRGAYKVRRG